METMEKQKTKFGVVELMPNGKIFGYVNVAEMSDKRESAIMEDYIEMGYLPIVNNYKLAGGSTSTIYYKYLDEDGKPEEGESTHVIHGVFIMKTELEKYVPTKNK